jgi:hypothetical protein
MNTVQQSNSNTVRLVWLAAALAFISAVAYVLIARGMLTVGDLQLEQDGGVIIFVAAGCYLLGGLLILLRRPWLWIIGAVINALVILFFINLYQDRLSVMFSPGGSITKIAQLLLEATLIYLIVATRRSAQSQPI